MAIVIEVLWTKTNKTFFWSCTADLKEFVNERHTWEKGVCIHSKVEQGNNEYFGLMLLTKRKCNKTILRLTQLTQMYSRKEYTFFHRNDLLVYLQLLECNFCHGRFRVQTKKKKKGEYAGEKTIIKMVTPATRHVLLPHPQKDIVILIDEVSVSPFSAIVCCQHGFPPVPLVVFFLVPRHFFV
jgi:hypothetical protein